MIGGVWPRTASINRGFMVSTPIMVMGMWKFDAPGQGKSLSVVRP